MRSGWSVNAMPNMSYASRSIASVPGWMSNSVGSVGVVGGHLDAHADAPAGGDVEQVDDDLEALGRRRPSGSGRPGRAR